MEERDGPTGFDHSGAVTGRGAGRGTGGGTISHGDTSGGMSRQQRLEMVHSHHRQTLWVHCLVLLLGVWLLAAPFTFGYLDPAQWVRPSGGRGVWFGHALHAPLRATLTVWSDIISGLLLLVFGWRSLRPNRPVSVWICCFVGIWLSLAPLLLWAPTGAAYLNDTLVGMLVIALTVLIPGMPNMMLFMKMGPPTPPGWSYNPSSWPQRSIMIALAFAGLLVSRYLAAFQLGYTHTAWEPFFDEGTRRVLNSSMSRSWPVSDAGLGAFAYTFEFLMGWMGGPARWRTMPWMVTFFGILVIPLGFVHVFLVISQPVTVGSWCTLCLLAAAIMLPMIPLQVDEVIAMGQNLAAAKREGMSLWTAFWKGGPAQGSTEDERTPVMTSLPDEPGSLLAASVRGMSLPWTLGVAVVLGLWLMSSPDMLGQRGFRADALHLGGALVVVVAVVALAEPLRAVRFLNLPLGLAVAVLPWVLGGAATADRVSALVGGLLVAALALPRGPVRERYGAWSASRRSSAR
jgi:hypothetical protein